MILVSGGALVLCFISVSAADWRWPDEPQAASVRIDTKVRFVDHGDDKSKNHVAVQADESPFREPTETEGFYNRPPGAGRFPVRVEPNFNSRGEYIQSKVISKNYRDTDSLHCRCVSEPECEPRPESESACGYGQYLCCYKRPTHFGMQNTEYFNEVQDERRLMLPGQESLADPFPPPQDLTPNGYFSPLHPGHSSETSHVRPYENSDKVLIGPDGPTGIIGPTKRPDVLVGPGGPTGIIGPETGKPQQIRQSESAQRGVLVGPGGPTGKVGPFDLRQAVLVGPGGPTGIIGPGPAPGRRNHPGVLIGPGGPTGIIGPGGGYGFRSNRFGPPPGQIGQIGPPSYFG